MVTCLKVKTYDGLVEVCALSDFSLAVFFTNTFAVYECAVYEPQHNI